MKKISADYIFPIHTDPIKSGILILDDKNTIIDCIDPTHLDHVINDVQHLEGILCPGFINAHCHLELSYLKNKIKENIGLNNFILTVEQLKKNPSEEIIIESIQQAEKEMQENGIVFIGDVSNTPITFPIKAKSLLLYHTFVEVFGSDPSKSESRFQHALSLYNSLKNNSKNNNGSITPHATYSASSSLLKKIKDFAQEHQTHISIHHQESEDENLFFLNQSGQIANRLKTLGTTPDPSIIKGMHPIESIANHLPENNPIQLVHNTVSTAEDIDFAKKNFNNLWWCICPNSNLYIEKKLPDIPLFIKKNLSITVGTDSYASNSQLSILEELKTIGRTFSKISLNTMLTWATFNGARFFNVDHLLGSFKKGSQPGVNLINYNKETLSLSAKSKVTRVC